MRLEAHYADGRVELVKDRETAQRLVDSHSPEEVRVWMVWWNDLGIGQELHRSTVVRKRGRTDRVGV
jgi:hypothetical protein